jgi:superfamily II DNA/RNA helicase
VSRKIPTFIHHKNGGEKVNFSEFQFHADLVCGLETMGFEETTPVQEKAIPAIRQQKDLIACAQTGTGKTAAFLLPILHKLATNPATSTNTLIIVPTRELALQIDQHVEGLAYFLDNVRSVPIYGGTDGQTWEKERKAFQAGAPIIIATPGKLISHLAMGHPDFSQLENLILDEADRMLDMGFHEDILQIFSYLPTNPKPQTLLFSATMPKDIRQLAKKILDDPEEVNISISQPAEGVMQAAYQVPDDKKVPLVSELLKGKKELKSVLVFCATKKDVSEVVQALKKQELNAMGVSSDLGQNEREDVLDKFKDRQFQVLVATDVLSRGIDIEGIDLIINYNVPEDPEDYVHRVGRTARVDATGVALTFINQKDRQGFERIQKLLNDQVKLLPLPPQLQDKKTKRSKDKTGHSSGKG